VDHSLLIFSSSPPSVWVVFASKIAVTRRIQHTAPLPGGGYVHVRAIYTFSSIVG
jgi:hypothetical protein